VSTRTRDLRLVTPAGFRLPPLTDAGGDVFEGPPGSTRTITTYWDTEDLRLTRAGVTLRHADDGWHLALPRPAGGVAAAPAAQRPEGEPGEPPTVATDLVTAFARGAALDSIATLRTTQRRVPVNGANGALAAAVVDEEIEVVDGDNTMPRVRELVIEWHAGVTRQQRAALLARLRWAGAEPVEPVPPIVRVLGERAGAPADVAPRQVVGGGSIAETLSGALAEATSVLVANDPGTRLGDDPEAVHQMRVATRKIRSHLRTFLRLVDEPWATGLREELHWLGGLLGEVRDAEVLLERLEKNIARIPTADRDSAEQLLADLRAHHADARDALLEAMRTDRYVALLDQLVSAAQRPRLLLRIDDQDDAEVLRGLVRGPVRSLRDAVASLPDQPPDEALHDVRIHVKRARYATEAVEPAFGKRARAFAQALVDVQDVLGEHQDAVIAADWLRDAAVKTDDERVGFAAGQLAAIEHAAALATRKQWPAAWEAADKKKLRAWL